MNKATWDFKGEYDGFISPAEFQRRLAAAETCDERMKIMCEVLAQFGYKCDVSCCGKHNN